MLSRNRPREASTKPRINTYIDTNGMDEYKHRYMNRLINSMYVYTYLYVYMSVSIYI